MTRRIPLALAAILVAALALPMAATAAPGRARCNDLRALARALALTKDQVSQTKEIYKDLRSTVEPLRDQIEPLREQLETLLDADNPAPGQVGQVVIDIDGLRDDIQAARADADSAFEAILTPEQLQKYHEFEAHCRPSADA
jgi:Spy/CpxP family protein refolding chaperone